MNGQGQLLSRTISWLRFPLIVGVVILHIDIPLDAVRGTVFGEFKYLLFSCLADFAVPLFFFISGFLFFFKSKFGWETYKKKLHRRFHSLVIPYLFWILAFMAMTLVIQMFLPSLNNRKLLSEYTLCEIFNSFWNYSGLGYGCPILAPLWFLRDLILMVIFTPLLYSLIKFTRGLFVVVLAVCYVLNVHIGIMGFPSSWLFFSLGAFFSIYHLDFAELSCRYRSFFVPMGLLLVIVMMALHSNGVDNVYLHKIYILVMIFVVLSVVSSCLSRSENNHLPLILTESSFFIYVFHGFYINPLSNVYSRVVPINTFTGIVGYFIVAFIACVIAVCVYVMLKKVTPIFCSIISGGR